MIIHTNWMATASVNLLLLLLLPSGDQLEMHTNVAIVTDLWKHSNTMLGQNNYLFSGVGAPHIVPLCRIADGRSTLTRGTPAQYGRPVATTDLDVTNRKPPRRTRRSRQPYWWRIRVTCTRSTDACSMKSVKRFRRQ